MRMTQQATESKSGATVIKLSTLTPNSSSAISLDVATGLFHGELEPASLDAAAIRSDIANKNGNSSA